ILKKLTGSYRNFLIVWLGQTFSILGSSLTSFGFSVWLFEQLDAAMPFVITGIALSLPRMILAPVAGTLADRYSRKRIMIFADAGAAVVSAFLLVMVVSGRFSAPLIYLSAFLSAIFGAFQSPAYMAATATMIPKDELVRFGGIRQFGDAAILLLTPILGALLYSSVGLGGIIIIDLATFIIAALVLILIPIPQPKLVTKPDDEKGKKSHLRTIVGDLKFSWRYLAGNKGLFGLLWFGAGINFFIGLGGIVTYPLVLSFGDETNLSIIQFVTGIALLVSGVVISAWGGPKKNRVAMGYLFIFLEGLGVLMMGVGSHFYLLVIGMIVSTFFDPFSYSLLGAIWQIKVPHDIQGRVFSVRMFVGQINSVISMVLAGLLSDYVFTSSRLLGSEATNGFLFRLMRDAPGRQYALVYILSALGICLLSLLAMFNRNIRQLEMVETSV
ncbi:MAG: MFS transporter, partial [Anaerolineaceae bacterium]|nr:MFS transporter [Anaerolineaceae bacterium]